MSVFCPGVQRTHTSSTDASEDLCSPSASLAMPAGRLMRSRTDVPHGGTRLATAGLVHTLKMLPCVSSFSSYVLKSKLSCKPAGALPSMLTTVILVLETSKSLTFSCDDDIDELTNVSRKTAWILKPSLLATSPGFSMDKPMLV